WFAIKDSFVTYIHSNTHELRFPMLVDQGFEVLGHHRNSNRNYDIEIINLQRRLRVKCETLRDYEEWMQSLSTLKEKAHYFINDSNNRFRSFAPIRHNQLGYWFINGKSYMESIAKAILLAKEEIFITDWWLSPEIMLIRPTNDESMRLDNLLGKIIENVVEENDPNDEKHQAAMDIKNRYFIGKDYFNLYEKSIEAVKRYDEDFIGRTLIPRTPWHDEALVVFGEVARDAARHFIQRWNIHKVSSF
ncbi:unnamed protein product, partial [Rotaria sp. Silwood2]